MAKNKKNQVKKGAKFEVQVTRQPGGKAPKAEKSKSGPGKGKKKGGKSRGPQKKHDKVEGVKNSLSNVQIETKGSPSKLDVPIELVALINLIEAEMAEYSVNSNIKTKVTSWQLFLYLLTVSYMHIKRVGNFTGTLSGIIPIQTTPSDLCVPIGLAKYLEGLGEFEHLGVHLRSSCSVASIPANAYEHYGATGNQTNVSRAGCIPWTFFPQTNNNANDNFGVSFKTRATDSTDSTLTNFIAADGVLSAISLILSQAPPTVALGSIPLRAPDGSAYARPRGNPFYQYPAVQAPTAFSCPVTKYNPQIAVLYSVYQYDNKTSRDQDKPIPQPKTLFLPVNQNVLVYWWQQPPSVLVWLGRRQDRYVPGSLFKMRVAKGTYLKSLLPLVKGFNGYAYGMAMNAAWKAYVANKQTSPPSELDPTSNLYTLFYTVCYHHLRRRFSQIEVLHLSSPALQNQDDGGIYTLAPQFEFTNDLWAGVKLPATLAHITDLIGPVVNEGVLEIPFIDTYDLSVNMSAQGTASAIPGPVCTSAYGWGADGLENYEYGVVANLWTTPSGCAGNQRTGPGSTFPGSLVIFNDTSSSGLVPVKVDVSFAQDLLGINTSVPYGMYPNTFNGTSAQTLIDQYYAFNMQANLVTQAPLIVSENPDLGSKVMTTNVDIDSDDASVGTLDPLAPTNASSIVEVDLNPGSVVSKSDLTSEEVMEGALLGISLIDDVEAPTATRRFRCNFKWRTILKLSVPTLPDTNTIGRFVTNFTSGANWTSLLSNIARQTMDPNSQFSKSVEDIRNLHTTSVSSTRFETDKTPVSKYFKGVLKHFADQTFSTNKHSVISAGSGSTSRMLGSVAKQKMDTIRSRYSVKGHDSSGAATGSSGSESFSEAVRRLDKARGLKDVGNGVADVGTRLYDGAHKAIRSIESWF